ncbi:ribonuclease D [Methylocystaceae bacterium]|nr:ribonuclease D [Methylocystaceae bacterium]
MKLLTNNDELAAICERFSHHEFVTVDTEFLRETTFWPKVCLIQIASPEEAIAIDTLADNIDLSPFFALMANPAIVKVFHAARQDLEIIWRLSRLIPAPLFDTQVAAMVCGFGEQASYLELVKAITRANLDKSSRFTDWSRRPLSDAQIEYAIADVTHLRDIYSTLLERLTRTNRLDWLDDEMQILSSPATYEQHPDNAWERLRLKVRKPRDLGVLMELAAWREQEAQGKDVPRSRVLKDDILVEIAQSAPRTIEALGNLRAFPKGMERSRSAADIVAAVERGLTRDPNTIPKIERARRGANGATVELLKVLLRQISEETGVAAKLIATIDDLEAIAADQDSETLALTGWRRSIFGEKALELKKGRLALAIDRGKVITLDWHDEQL